jgi:hypothetical protein
MPTVFRYGSYRFFFFSNEGDPQEPLHVHVRRENDEAKIWLEPDVVIDSSFGFNAKELNGLLRLARDGRAQIERAWNEHFGQRR